MGPDAVKGCAPHPVIAVEFAEKFTVPAGTVGEKLAPNCGKRVAVKVTSVFSADGLAVEDETVMTGLDAVTVTLAKPVVMLLSLIHI